MSFIKEMYDFLRKRKKLWLAPIFSIIIIIAGLLSLSQGSVFAPFIYTLF